MARADNRKVICKKAQRQKELLKLCIQTHFCPEMEKQH